MNWSDVFGSDLDADRVPLFERGAPLPREPPVAPADLLAAAPGAPLEAAPPPALWPPGYDAPAAAAAPVVKRSRYFVFTLNLGLVEAEAVARIDLFRAALEEMFDEEFSYASCAHELAPTTGQHHIQGYIELAGKRQWTLQQFLECDLFEGQPENRSLWARPARGTAQQNAKYTQKASDQGRWSFCEGIARNYGQGRDPGLARSLQLIDAGEPLRKVYRQEPDASARHYRFLDRFKLVTSEPRMWPTKVCYIYGPSGTGKSRLISQYFNNPDLVYVAAMPKAGGNFWWDGYDEQPVVVIDEYSPSHFGQGHNLFMQRLVDRYPLKVPVHGGQVNFAARLIIIGSNYAPEQIIFSPPEAPIPWGPSHPIHRRMYDPSNPWIIQKLGNLGGGVLGFAPDVYSENPLVLAARIEAQVRDMAAVAEDYQATDAMLRNLVDQYLRPRARNSE